MNCTLHFGLVTAPFWTGWSSWDPITAPSWTVRTRLTWRLRIIDPNSKPLSQKPDPQTCIPIAQTQNMYPIQPKSKTSIPIAQSQNLHPNNANPKPTSHRSQTQDLIPTYLQTKPAGGLRPPRPLLGFKDGGI